MPVTQSDLELLVTVTGAFENQGDPYKGVSGDFDGQGISCGVLQWNIGQNSLQPLVLSVGKAIVFAQMPEYGDAMWIACNSTIGNALKIVRSWQSNSKLAVRPKRELINLMDAVSMRRQQDFAILKIAQSADMLATRWANDRKKEFRTTQELVYFFDILTQNGSLKDIFYRDVYEFQQAAGNQGSTRLICQWLAATNSKYAGMVDCHKNARLWNKQWDIDTSDLLVLSYLRSQKSILRWRGDVLNRKGTIATRSGWVHEMKFDLTGVF
jgi:hypothetical protein